MRRLLTALSSQIICASCFVVLFALVGNVKITKAAGVPDLEGEWVRTSPGEQWDRLTIERQDDSYNVIINYKVSAKPKIWEGPFQGNSRQIIREVPLSLDTLQEIYAPQGVPTSVIRKLAGKVAFRYRFTLSQDGRSAEYSQDDLHIAYNKNTGRLTSYKILPFSIKLTLLRVPESVKETSARAIAQVESRGEFYVLTKDGRKLTGTDANQIPLEEGTRVITGSSGYVRMKLPDDTTFTVGPNSDIVIDSFVYDTDNTPRKIIANVSKGVFRWVTGKAKPVKDPAEMKVNLPVMAVGIRGTDFEATAESNGTGSVVLHFGQLEITEKKTGFTFILNAGYKVTSDADGSVSRPIKAD